MFKRSIKLLLILFVGVAIFSTNALTQQTTTETLTFDITNVCSSGIIAQPIVFTISFAQGLTTVLSSLGNLTILPGQSLSLTSELTAGFTPTSFAVSAVFNSARFETTFDPIQFNTPLNDAQVAGGCFQVIVTFEGDTSGGGSDDGGQTDPTPPTGNKPVVQGQTFDQVVAALAGMGIVADIDGSQTSPKLGNVGDPMLLRSINGLSAQVIWVSAPGSLRSVITWDNPLVDLDLIVIGLPSCFQLNPAGILAEFCDRFPFGPAGGFVFPVIIINWSLVNQAYVISLSP